VCVCVFLALNLPLFLSTQDNYDNNTLDGFPLPRILNYASIHTNMYVCMYVCMYIYTLIVPKFEALNAREPLDMRGEGCGPVGADDIATAEGLKQKG
jgi:hypothetical protein